MNTSDFLRDLLIQCVGSVMIEPDQWNFPNGSFDRGYLNERLKQTVPLNKLTRERLLFVFSHLFNPSQRSGSRFDESYAVTAANSLITLFFNIFSVDLSRWKNSHTADNSAARGHLYHCLELVLNLSEHTVGLPKRKITAALSEYLTQEERSRQPAPLEYPTFLGAAPYGMTEHFIGRTALISSAVEYLAKSTPVFLHGIGGIGKTEIAKAVVKQFRQTPVSEHGIRSILWVPYIEDDFARSLVHAMPLDTAGKSLDRLFQEAIDIINHYQDSLLIIIDNVESDTDDLLLKVTEYLPCRFLITSRVDGFHSFTRLPVPSMGMDNCKSLFYCYYHNTPDDSSLKKIIGLADCHTITVELLAKIADTEEMLLHEFLQSLIECGFKISAEEASTAHEKLRSDGRIIEQLQKLFRIYGCTPSQDRLLTQISTIPSMPFDFQQGRRWFSLRNRTDLNALAKRGWIKKESILSAARSTYRYSIHSVIAAAIRSQREAVLYDYCQGFLRKITLDMQKVAQKNDAEKKKLIQFSWSLNDIFQGDFHSELDSDFLWAMAEIYRDIGHYKRALPLLEQLKALYAKLHGEDCIQLSSVWNSCGLIHFNLSQFEQALTEYQKSHELLTNHFGAENLTDLAKTELGKLNMNIGNVYRKLDFPKAEPYFHSAYETFRDVLGENAHCTLLALGYHAIYSAQHGDFENAEQIYLDVYGRTEAFQNDRDMLLLRAEVSHHLGSLYSDIAPEKAMSYLNTARDIMWDLLSPTHPDTLDVLNSICSLRIQLESDFPPILEELERLLALYIDTYGDKNPDTATIYNNIGLCHYYMKHPEEAIRYYREAIRIDELTYGKDHEATGYIHNNIGAVYSENDQPELAVPEHLHALRVYETAHPNHLNLDLAQTHCDLADAYLRLGDLDECMNHLNEAFPIYEKLLPDDSHILITPHCTLANLLVAAKDFIQAEIVYSHVLWLMVQNGYDENHPAMLEMVDRLREVKECADIQREKKGQGQ